MAPARSAVFRKLRSTAAHASERRLRSPALPRGGGVLRSVVTRKRRPFVKLRIFLSILVLTAWASATQLTVSTYSMYNGGTGSYDYRDFTYVPCNGVCDVTSAPLSGGTGKLTDGVTPALSWYQYGWWTPWVGWYTPYTNETNPIVTFNF